MPQTNSRADQQGKRPTVKPGHAVSSGGASIAPIKYIRNSGQVLIQYLDGPKAGTQATVPLNGLTHPNGDYEVVKAVRRVRSDS